MAFDGRVKFDTSLDKTGLEKGLKDTASIAKIAAGNIVADVTKTVVKGAADIATSAVKIGSDFEAAMSNVYAVSLATGENAEKLKKAAIDAGEATKFSASEAANALEYLSLAGYDAEKSIKALPKVLNLAAAGNLDLAYASDLLTDSMAVMGLGIEDMDNFSDQLAMAASKANTSIAQLGEAVLVAGGQAKLCGMDVAEMNTALGILADKGIKGSEGGTALRNTLKNLYTPTKQAADELERLGVVTSENGKLRDVQDVLKDLSAALSGLSEDEKVRAVGEIFDTRTIAAATNLLDDCNERWDELEGYLRDCDGAAGRMAETMQDNLKGKLELVSSAAESCGIAFYESISEPLKDAAEEGAQQLSILANEMQEGELKEGIEELGEGVGVLITDAIQLAREVLPSILKGVGWLCENMRVVGPLVIGVVGSIKAYTIATTAAEAITALMNSTLALNPYALAIAGVVALTAGIVALKNAEDKKFENIQMQIDKTKELAAAQKQLKEETQAQIRTIEDNHKNANELLNDLDKLLKIEDKSLSEKEKTAEIVDKLNSLYPDLNLNYNKQTDELKDQNDKLVTNTTELKKNFEERRKIMLKEAYEEQYKEAVASLPNLKAQHSANVITQRNEGGQADAYYQKRYNSLITDDGYGDFVTATIGSAFVHAENILDDAGEAFFGGFGYKDDKTKTEEKIRGLADAVEESAGMIAENYATQLRSMAEMVAIDYSEVDKSALNKFVNGLLEANINWASDDTHVQIAIQEYVDEWLKTLPTEMEAEAVKALLQGIGFDLSSYIAQGMIQGLNSEGNSVEEAGAKLGVKATGGVAKGADTHSPSKKTLKTGKDIAEGLIIGMLEKSEEVEKAGESIGDSAVEGVKSNALGYKEALAEMLSVGNVPKENAEKATEAYENAMDVLQRQLEAGLITEKEYFAEMEKNRDKHLSKGTKEWLDATQELYENALDEELELLEHRYDTGLVTEEEYYKELKRIRDEYFIEDSEEWRRYTEKLVDYEKDKSEDIIDVIEDTTDKIKDAYEDAFDDVNDAIEDMTEGIRDAGDFYVTGTVEINGKEVEYGSLVDMDKRNKWMEELYNRVSGLKERLKGLDLTDEEFKSFWEHFGSMGEEGMYEYGNLLLNSSDADFVKHVRGYLENESWGQKTADFFYEDAMKDAAEEYMAELEKILTEAGKELPEDFFTLGELAGEKFSVSFLDGVREAIEDAKKDLSTFFGGSGFSVGSGGNSYANTYNFYSSGQTVSEQLNDASRYAAVERARYG